MGSNLFDRIQEPLLDCRLGADDLNADFGVRDAISGNPVKAAAFGHIEPQLPHILSNLFNSV